MYTNFHHFLKNTQGPGTISALICKSTLENLVCMRVWLFWTWWTIKLCICFIIFVQFIGLVYFFYKTSPKSSFWQCRLGLRPYRYRRISVWQVLVLHGMLPPSVSDSVREGPLGNPPRGTWLDCQVNDDTGDSKRFACTCISIKNEEKVKKKKKDSDRKSCLIFVNLFLYDMFKPKTIWPSKALFLLKPEIGMFSF